MSAFTQLQIANRALNAHRQMMDIATENIANALTPGYKAKNPIVSASAKDPNFSEMLSAMERDDGMSSILKGHDETGSQVAEIAVDQTQGPMMHMPNHPLADQNGMVEMSNVDSAKEMINMANAVKNYKAILTTVSLAQKAAQEAIQMNRNA